MIDLFKNKGFSALFTALFLGAFNDNLFRTALVTLITYGLASFSDADKGLIVTGAIGVFMLPFFLFATFAGQLADKYDKAKLVRMIKAAEVVIALFIATGFITQSPFFLMLVLFCMGAQSAFFGPLKYSLLPELLHKNQLIAANGWVEAGTFVSILLGTVWGALLISIEGSGAWLVGGLVITFALVGYAASRLVPAQAPGNKSEKLSLNIPKEIIRIVGMAHADTRTFRAILGIAWFWVIGATFLSQLPILCKSYLMVDEDVFTLLLSTFTLGIGAGSLFCNSLLKSEVTTKYVPLFSLLIIPFLFHFSATGDPLPGTTLSAFLMTSEGWRILFDIFGLCFCGGLYIVPLYALIQTRTTKKNRAQIIAANNILDAGFMVVASVIAACLLAMGFSIPTLFLMLAIGQILTTLYIFRVLPDSTMRGFLYGMLKLLYRLEVKGLENFKKAGKRVVIISNHTSFLDAMIIAAILPEKPLFAINTYMAERWWLKPMLVLVRIFPMDPTNPLAVRSLIDEAKKNEKILIFPEGRITMTGSLMKVYQGPGLVADKSDSMLLPIRIEGAQYSFFSRFKATRKLFPHIRVSILPPRKMDVPEDYKGRQRREALGQALYQVMADMVFETNYRKESLFASLIKAAKLYGRRHVVTEDIMRKPLSYGGLLMKSLTLAHFFNKSTNDKLGLLLPNTNALVVSFWACQAAGKAPALMNYSTGLKNALSTAKTALLTKVITSRQFVEKAKLEEMIGVFKDEGLQIIYLEDLRDKIVFSDKLFGLAGMIAPRWAYNQLCDDQDPERPSVVLFTSGSEGVPKAVVLSHSNLQANHSQLDAVVDFSPNDIVFNALPLFHSFGLSAGMILPVLSGIRTFFYVSPLHYRIVPELIYETSATIMFGTDTFLAGYAHVAHAYDFYSLRYVFAGAEKLKDKTRGIWAEKFGVRIFEGYGATETSPVLAVNTPMRNKTGTVGAFLPGIKYRLEKVPGVEEGGRLHVRGPNVMLGYMFADKPGVLVKPKGGWYDTGDIVDIDEEGTVNIKGRAKRFAKIGGEMISLTAVEEFINGAWPDNLHAIIARPDPKKGEQLILYTDCKKVSRKDLIAEVKKEGLSELFLPRDVVYVPKMPLLGTGKVDYQALTNLKP